MANYTKKALKTFLENEYWREYYETAPSEECKRYIEREFVSSLFDNAGEEGNRKALEPTLSVDDWKHLLKWSDPNPFRSYCKKKIAELEQKQSPDA